MSFDPGHLVRRFVGTVRPRRLPSEAEAWARSFLSAAELNLWDRLSAADRVHSITVARLVIDDLGVDVDDDVVVAALCHDAGKGVARLGTVGRVVATLIAPVVSDATAARLAWRSGWLGRVGMYLRYPGIGADLLAEGGSEDLVVTWAREHHLPADEWSVPIEIGAALASADHRAV